MKTINADFSERLIVHSESLDWIDSPISGVSRRPLDRVGEEVARATSIVRYDPGSSFSAHVHTGGEEFFVLDGVFQDEHGDYPAGSYIRNPPQSSHTPGSEPGCIIFVKLWQFDLQDRVQVNVQMNDASTSQNQSGVSVKSLHKDAHEQVDSVRLDSSAVYQLDTELGAEAFVLAGSANESGDALTRGSWLRLPPGSALDLQAGNQGAHLWLKTGHLGQVERQIEQLKQATDPLG